jgi:DNA invertase Pin-like site-specific DNA recombinase
MLFRRIRFRSKRWTAVYVQVAVTRQVENNISIPDRLKKTRDNAQAKRWIAVDEFVEVASAGDDKRAHLQRMMDAVRKEPSPFDVILIHSQSR